MDKVSYSTTQSDGVVAYLWYPENGDFLVKRLLIARDVTPKCTYLLLEVTSVLFVDEDEVKIITRAELFVHVAECRGQVKPAQKQPNWDRFAWNRHGINRDISGDIKTRVIRTSHGRAIHDLKFCDGFTLVVLIWWRTGRLSADDR